MNTLKQLIFMIMLVFCVSISASAQKKDDQNKTPPKKDPPKIVVPDKKPDPPKEDKGKDNRGKKPEMAFIRSVGETEVI